MERALQWAIIGLTAVLIVLTAVSSSSAEPQEDIVTVRPVWDPPVIVKVNGKAIVVRTVRFLHEVGPVVAELEMEDKGYMPANSDTCDAYRQSRRLKRLLVCLPDFVGAVEAPTRGAKTWLPPGASVSDWITPAELWKPGTVFPAVKK